MGKKSAAHSGRDRLRLDALGGNEPRVCPAAAADLYLLAGGGALEVVAEVIAEHVTADFDGC
jgi:hypothetical protein